VVTGADGEELKFCRSKYRGFNFYDCDFLRSELEAEILILPVTFVSQDNEQFTEEVVLTKENVECDIGCGCGWADVNCPFGKVSDFNSEDVPDGMIASMDDMVLEMAEIPSCPVHDSKFCDGYSCGDVFVYRGRVEAIAMGCDCCSSEFECGTYDPSVENLNFLPLQNITVTRDQAAAVISAFDILYSILFLLVWKFMGHKVKVIMRQTDEDNVTAGDYTLVVQGLPVDAKEEEIRKHFSDLYDLSEPDWEFKGWICGLWGKKKPRTPEEITGYNGDIVGPELEPVKNVDLHGKKNYIGSWVADVNIAHPNGSLIRRCQAMKKYSNKLLSGRAMVKKFSEGTPLKGGTNASKLAKAERKLESIKNKIAKTHHSLKKSASSFEKIDNACMLSFVTFENEDSLMRCLEDYGRYGGRYLLKPWTWLRPPFPPALKFRGKHRLKVREAPEPSNILWENLETSGFSLFLRKAVTSTVTISMLAISLATIVLVTTSKDAFAESVPDLTKCTAGLPQVYNVTTMDFVWQESFDELCPEGKSYISVEGFGGIDESSSAEEVQEVIDTYSETCMDPCVGDDNSKITCVGPQDDGFYHRLRLIEPNVDATSSSAAKYTPYTSCPDPVVSGECSDENGVQFVFGGDYNIGGVTDDFTCDGDLSPQVRRDPVTGALDIAGVEQCERFQKQTVKGCFCMGVMMDAMLEKGLLAGGQHVYANYGDVCGKFARQYSLAQALLIGAAVLVTVVNVLLKTAIQGMASFEHHHSLSQQTKAISTNVAITLFVNTALIVMIVNASIDFEPINQFGLGMGKAEDFDFQWYTNVGSAITMTMVINAITPHLAPLAGYYIIGPLKRCFASTSSTQRSLNKKFEGPTFLISTRFPMVLNTLCVTMVFSSALPVLLPIAFLACTFFYHVDKFLLLRFYHTPPCYDAKLASGTVHLLPFVMIVHLAFAVWVYSMDDVFQSTCLPFSGFDSYMEKANTFDRLGVLPRIMRKNVMPVFVSLILTIVLVVYNYLGHWIVKLIVGSAFKGVFRIIFYIPKKIIQACCGKTVDEDREFNPPFTKEFVRGYPKNTTVPSLSNNAGWVLDKDDDGFKVHSKKWLDNGEVMGVKHRKNGLKRTWEAIRDAQVHTYNIRMNPEYTDAMIAKDQLTRSLGIGAATTEATE